MKKTKLLAIFFIFGLLLTGCDSKSLSCTKEEEIDAGKTKEVQLINFDNNKIKSYEATMSIALTNEYKDYADTLLESLEEPFKDFNEEDGIEYKTKVDGNNISVTVSGDYNKMSDDAKQSLGIADNASFDAVKESLENDGYSCK